MRIGLIDVDSHNFPNLPLMKIATWHKAQGHSVDWWTGESYDRVYISRVFTDTYTSWLEPAITANEIIRGGTGYDLDNKLPPEIESIYPDYSIYPTHPQDTAYGFFDPRLPTRMRFLHSVGKGRPLQPEGCRPVGLLAGAEAY